MKIPGFLCLLYACLLLLASPVFSGSIPESIFEKYLNMAEPGKPQSSQKSTPDKQAQQSGEQSSAQSEKPQESLPLAGNIGGPIDNYAFSCVAPGVSKAEPSGYTVGQMGEVLQRLAKNTNGATINYSWKKLDGNRVAVTIDARDPKSGETETLLIGLDTADSTAWPVYMRGADGSVLAEPWTVGLLCAMKVMPYVGLISKLMPQLLQEQNWD